MISILKESRYLGMPYEQCVFCNKGTQYWSAYKDTPVCKQCARYKQEWEVPTKEKWVASYGRKTRNYFSQKSDTVS